MPKDVVYVGRPGFWGNPYTHDFLRGQLSLRLYRNTAQGIWNPLMLIGLSDAQVAALYAAHLEWRARAQNITAPQIKATLGGRDLACWCLETVPCHADILLELANA